MRRCALLLVLLVSGCDRSTPQVEPVIRPVRIQEIYATGGERTRTFTGVAEAGQEMELSFRVRGVLDRVAVKVGDRVQPGALIAELDDTDYRLSVQEAEASLDRSRSEERNAQSGYERIQSLYENRNASLNDLDAARTAFESAEAAVASAGKRVEMAQQQLAYCRLLAPAEGAIAAVEVEVNENVSIGRRVVVLTSESDTEVEIAVPEILITRIREGQEVSVRFDALSGLTTAGVVSEVGVATLAGATYLVTIRLLDQDAAVRPGMAAEVDFVFAGTEGRPRIIVPPLAVGEDRDGRFVFVVEPSGDGLGVARRSPVVIGALEAEGLEIVEGLHDGALLIIAGVSQIEDGRRVRLGTDP